MLYGELARYSIFLNVKLRMITFWLKHITGKRTKLSFLIYELLRNDYKSGICEHKLLNLIKSIVDEAGYSNVWNAQYNQEGRKWGFFYVTTYTIHFIYGYMASQ